MNQTFAVTGMTCEHCVRAVTEEVGALPGVQAVSVDLHAGGASTVDVTADRTLGEAELADALEEAGDYRLTAS